MTPHDREREARDRVAYAAYNLDKFADIWAALDAYRDAVEARVRWDQQADAEANG